LTVPEKSLANLKPIRTSEEARALGKRGNEARRAKKEREAQLQAEADDRSRERLAKLAYEALFTALQDEDVPVQARLTAAREALDRLEGRPTQRVEQATVEARPLAEMPQEELVARLRVLEGGKRDGIEPTGTDSVPNAH